ncbi:MAG: hypothetical protein RLZZ628_2241 [Bacteroidota bacterium]|jgi:hypothetical protein
MKNAFFGLTFLAALCACKNETKKPVAMAPPPPVVIATPNPPPQTTPAPAPTSTPAAAAQTTCYQLVTKTKDVSSCQLTQDAKGISGYYAWEPNEKDGAVGILRNAKMLGKDTLKADFLYVIEGSTQMEEKYFIVSATKMVELSGELTEVKGSNPIKLVPKDKKKLKPETVLAKVDCSKVAEIVQGIQTMNLK